MPPPPKWIAQNISFIMRLFIVVGVVGFTVAKYAMCPVREVISFDALAKLRLFRGLTWYILSQRTGPIIADYEEHRPISPSFNGITALAWFQEKQGNTLKFKRPSNAIWRHFENNTLVNATHSSEQKSSPYREVTLMHSMSYIGRYFISSEYGHKVLSRLSIKEDLQKSANEWFESHVKGDWVAIHYRGTDLAKGMDRTYRRRYKIELRPYVTYLKEVLDSQCSIFACSDQAQFIDEMKAAFPGRVFARDIKRSYDNTPLHLHFVPFEKRDNYEQERDALIDVLVLAKAGLIYTNGSGFVDMVRYFNPETKIVSLDGRTIGRGKNNAPIPEPDLFKRLSLPWDR